MKKIIMALSLCVFSFAAFAGKTKNAPKDFNSCYVQTEMYVPCANGTSAFWGTITTKVDCESKKFLGQTYEFVQNPCGVQSVVENFLP